MLQQYGDRVHYRTAYGRLINTDFSGPIGRMGRRNSKTDIVWAKSIDSARDLLDYPQEKFDQEKKHLNTLILAAFSILSTKRLQKMLIKGDFFQMNPSFRI